MPNWCYNKLTIEGPKDEIARFKNGLVKDEKGYICILDSYFPRPEELMITSGFLSEDNPEYETWKAAKDANLEKYGFADWYDWSIVNWGSKWQDTHTELEIDGEDSVTFSYDTAWSPIVEGLKKISKDFPTIRFENYMDEESGAFRGTMVIRDGELLFYKTFSPSDYDVPFVPWDSPEYEEWSRNHDEWCWEQQSKIDAEVDRVK